jgi:hypothetical protein
MIRRNTCSLYGETAKPSRARSFVSTRLCSSYRTCIPGSESHLGAANGDWVVFLKQDPKFWQGSF